MTDVFECGNCGHRTFYDKRRCLECGSEDFSREPAGQGELLAVTVVHVTPEGVREPNPLGLAKFSGGANLIAQLDDDLAVGDAVTLVGGRDLRETDDGVITGPRLASVE